MTVVVMTAAALVACGEPGATVSPSKGGTPVSGTTSPRPAFHATGFSTIIPAGWTDQTNNSSAVATVSGDGTVVLLFTAADGGHIDVRIAPQPVPDDQLAAYVASVSQNGATNLSSAQTFTLDSSSGVYITYNLASSAGVQLEDQDMVVNRSGDTYDIVLNTSQSDFGQESPALQAVLDGWRWAAS